MLISATKNLTIDIGRDFIEQFNFYQNAAKTLTVDMTGYVLEAQIRSSVNQNSTLILTFDCQWVSQSTGKTQIVLTDTQTDAVTVPYARKSYWDYKITDSLGIIYTYFAGSVIFNPRPTA